MVKNRENQMLKEYEVGKKYTIGEELINIFSIKEKIAECEEIDDEGEMWTHVTCLGIYFEICFSLNDLETGRVTLVD